MTETVNDPRFLAAVDLLRRTGMSEFQIRYDDDPEPTVWFAVGIWKVDDGGRPTPKGQNTAYDACAGMDPLRAVLRLCEATIDSAECAHCHRPSGITDDWQGRMPLSEVICWYVFDPEQKTYRRSCEAEVT